ncbi:rRNA-processing protein EFG1 [Rhodotorula diobovata]|uniref:rRNA-processing protein EFG1 n=1 Tax=Rhodotorula diobovata TaxID=5288 RepID=A0A5C5FWE8_9BASI|nr:rRNA-processing protein EFG1 [Rhodotorula diobovata]TNY16992.1 rRNA-processing protein EFG1 [Rhodotorula diobovata]TNY21100.1 rRNA-processing protein EFG1 [Rhodotorula diobovata]
MAEQHSAPSRGKGRGRGGAGSVSKLKAQLRQTKRLLARDDLNPDVRTTSERRLALLEDELAKAEQSNVEKKMVQRYRGVKFFERQKLLRKIKQAKKALSEVPDSAEAQATLLDARVDLYYVLRYPKTDKYVALFPDGVYAPFVPPSALDKDASTPAELKRQTLRAAIRDRIESGAMPAEAELGELGIEGEDDVGAGPAKRERDDEALEEEAAGERAAKKAKPAAAAAVPVSAKAKKAPAAPVAPEAEDEEEDEAGEADDAPGVEAGAAPKKKENRKQRKERKRAEQAAAGATGGGGAGDGDAPAEGKKAALASQDAAMKDASWKSKTKGEQLAEQDDFFA